MLRRKNIKKGLLFLLTAIMTCSLFYLPASAEPAAVEEDMIQYLLSVGTEQGFLDEIGSERIQRLYIDLAESGYKAVFVGYETETVEVIEGDPRLRGQISTNSLRLTHGFYNLVDWNTGRLGGVQVVTSYRWLNLPTTPFNTDAHTFAFDRNLFTIGGMFAESGFTVNRTGQWHSVDLVNGPALASEGGLGWFLRRQVNNSITRDQAVTFSGGAHILLRPRNANATSSSLRSQMFYTYAQPSAGVGISLGISGASVVVTGGNHNRQTLILNYQ